MNPPMSISSGLRRKYAAFISYRHLDNRQEGRRWGSWLHEQLESFEVPARVAGEVDRDGGRVPSALFPVFRDEKELAADAALTRVIHDALDASQALVVVASPRAAVSDYVNEEIVHFQKSGRASRIITVVIEGTPNAGAGSPDECLPPALRSAPAAGGGGPRNPGGALWVDLRAPGSNGGPPEQGWTSLGSYYDYLLREKGLAPAVARPLARAYATRLREARLRIIAGVLNVSYGALYRRSNEFAVRRLQRWLGVAALFVAVIGGLAWIANERRREALHAQGTANRLINEMLHNLGDKLAPLGQLDVLDDVARNAEEYFAGLQTGARPRDAILGHAMALIKRGEVLESGAVSKAEKADALAKHRQALALLETLKRPSPEARLHMAVACERISDLLEDDDSAAALAMADRGLQIIAGIHAPAGSFLDVQARRVKGQIHERVGDLLEDNERQLAGAEAAFQKSYEVRKALYEGHPGQGIFARDFGVSLARLGDVQLADGRWDAARASYAEGLKVRQEMIRRHGLNTGWQSEVGRSYFSLADVEVRLGKLSDARANLEDALRIRQLLADFDPPNDRWQGDVIRTLVALADGDSLDWRRQPEQERDGALLARALIRLKKAEGICQLLEQADRWKDKLTIEAVNVQLRLASVNLLLGDGAEAGAACARARAQLEKKARKDGKSQLAWARLARLEADAALAGKDQAAALLSLRNAFSLWKKLAEGDDRQYEPRLELALCCQILASLLQSQPGAAVEAAAMKAEGERLIDSLRTRGLIDFRGRLSLGLPLDTP